jgi:hypothetical protein
MATSGAFTELLWQELGFSRGLTQARAQELRDGDLLPVAGHGLTAAHFGIRPVANWIMALVLTPERFAVVKTVRSARSWPRIDIDSRQIFEDLSVAKATNFGAAIESLLADAAAGRLQEWKEKHGPLVVDIVDSQYAEIRAIRHEGHEIAFKRSGSIAPAPSAFRIFRVDSRLFERVAEVLNRTERRDPHSGEIIAEALCSA